MLRRPAWFLLALLLLSAGPPATGQTVPPNGKLPADTAPPADVPAAPPVGSENSPVPVPTDQPPPDVPAPSPIPLGQGFLFSGALDGRARTATRGRSNQAWVHAAELDLNHPFTRGGQPLANVKVQVIAENPPDVGGGHDVQLGEAYVLYKLPFQTETDSTAYLKVGQFQLPFGLLAVYDPHLLLQQPLYAQALGIRNDFGVAVSGRFYGYLNYDFSLTSGTGPNHLDLNANRVVVFRLGRTFVTRNGVVNVGGSLLQGRLPITDLDAAHPDAFELPPSGYVRPDRGGGAGGGYVAKTRIAGDGTINYKSLTGRGEAMIGADVNRRVLGYYVEANYRFSPRASALAAHATFDYPLANSLSNRDSVGLTYAPDANLTLRALYENLYDVPLGAPGHTRHRLTAQVLLRF